MELTLTLHFQESFSKIKSRFLKFGQSIIPFFSFSSLNWMWRLLAVILVKKQRFGKIAYLAKTNSKAATVVSTNHAPQNGNKLKWSWKCDDEAVYWSAATSSSADNRKRSLMTFILQERSPEEEEEVLQEEEAWRDSVTKSPIQHISLWFPSWSIPMFFCCINSWIFLQIQIRRHYCNNGDNFECEQICFLRQREVTPVLCCMCMRAVIWFKLGLLACLLSDMLF